MPNKKTYKSEEGKENNIYNTNNLNSFGSGLNNDDFGNNLSDLNSYETDIISEKI